MNYKITPYINKVFNADILSYLNVDSEGDVVSAKTWKALWGNILNFTQQIDVHMTELLSPNGIITTLIADHERIIEEHALILADYNILKQKFATLDDVIAESDANVHHALQAAQIAHDAASALGTELIHYGDTPPTNPYTKLWARKTDATDLPASLANVMMRVPKIITEGHTVGFKRVIALQEGMAGEPLGADDKDYVTVDIATYGTAELPFLNGEIATYGNGGRLNVNTPIKDFNCANKAYVDKTAKETANDRIPKIAPASAPFLSVLTVNRSDADWNSDVLNDTAFSGKLIDDPTVEGKAGAVWHGGYLVPRDPRGNLWTGEPVDDEDCANKIYVDNKIANINTTGTPIDLTEYVKKKDIAAVATTGDYNDLKNIPESVQVDTDLTVKDNNNGLPSPILFDGSASKQTLYWNGKKAEKFYADTDGATTDNPIIINTAEELAYVASAKYEDTYGKHFKIADGIDKIVLQSQAYSQDIIALDSAEAVRDYFKEIIDIKKEASTLFLWVSNTWNEANMCFAGHFDGNGVEIYGMYTSDYTVANSGLSTNYAGGLFGLIDSAVISNVAVKNSYVNLGKSTENFQFGLIASYGKDCDTSKGDNVSYINHCIAANNYVYKQVNETGFTYSGVLLGGNIVGNYIIQNCLVYGNTATGYSSTQEYDLPIIGRTVNGLKATDEFVAAHPDWIFNDSTNNLVETVLENSIILGTPLHSPIIYVNAYVLNRVLSCNSISNCLKNVYVDWDLDKMQAYSRDNYYNYWFNKDYFLANSGATITESDVIGNNAVTNASNLAWGIDWFVPTTYSGKATPFEFTQFVQNALLNLINGNQNTLTKLIKNNATAISDNKSAINSKKITSYRATNKYTFAWNAMYLITSNSGNADITLYNSTTGAVVVDGDGKDLPSMSTCLLILPQETIGTDGTYRTCILLGQSGSSAFTVNSRQFHVTSGNIYFTPPYAATVFKVAF